MSRLQGRPSPAILLCFKQPRSVTEVVRDTEHNRDVVWKHLRKAEHMGLVEPRGSKKPKLNYGPPMKLYSLTDKGEEYLTENTQKQLK